MKDNTIIIGIYKKEDYSKILSIAVDKKRMPETWEKWKKVKKKAKKELKGYGIKTKEIEMVPSELKAFCEYYHLKINRCSRSAFISYKVSKS